MNNNTYLDLVFDGRNKEYGAYELRLNYDRRLKKSLLVMLSFAGCMVLFSFWFQYGHGTSDQPRYRNVTTSLTDFILEKNDPIELPKSVASTTPVDPAILPPEIVENTQVQNRTPVDTASRDMVTDPNAVLSSGPAIQGNGGTEIVAIQPTHTGVPNGNAEVVANTVETITAEPNKIESAQSVDSEPEFPGGIQALVNYIQNELTYPAPAIDANYSCQVVVDFVVDEKGEISKVETRKSQKYGCDAEAIRVVKQMPKWKPALLDGKPVKCYFSVPINFILEESD